MTLEDEGNGLRRAREGVLAGDTATVVDRLDDIQGERVPGNLLTAGDAAAQLGIQSELVVKLWCRAGFLACVTEQGEVLIPTTEVERVRESPEVRSIRWSDHLHDASAELGSEEGLDDDELRELTESRPGRLPWQGQTRA